MSFPRYTANGIPCDLLKEGKDQYGQDELLFCWKDPNEYQHSGEWLASPIHTYKDPGNHHLEGVIDAESLADPEYLKHLTPVPEKLALHFLKVGASTFIKQPRKPLTIRRAKEVAAVKGITL